MAGSFDRRALLGCFGGAIAWPFAARAQQQPQRVLYCTHSAGYRHDAIPLSQTILRQLGKDSGLFDVTATEDMAELTAERLARYAAVMFYTTGELPMSDAQKAALLDFVRSGGGFLGAHCATDTFYEWPDYRELIGGYFDGHPWHQSVRIDVADPSSSLVSFLGRSFEIKDEIYQIRDFDERASHVLLRLDPASVDLSRDGVHRRSYGWPLAWTRSYGRGRVFYTGLGHEEAVWQDARYQRLLRNAIQWSMQASN
jgi:type 1 glutamine amidotransferase